MKKLLVLAVVAALSFWGCSENSNITEPTDSQSNQSFLKVNTDNVSELSAEAKAALKTDGMSTLSKSFFPSSVSVDVDAEEGASIRFILANSGTYSLGKLSIAGGAFAEDATVGIATVGGEAALDFTPNVQFATPAELTVGFIGVDIHAGDDVHFVYMVGDQEVEVANSGIYVGNGWVVVVKAQLGHFSRFGFTK
ncbi:hypothetical protein MNBD_IGNAVI01-1088 [hydrothermal vent metagenome]|uniref:Uncharacterized protein n=1 Tax=hydrothermal vent metagenome TaxID=652676 RepID=A0A3B1D934_9ZZZZ